MRGKKSVAYAPFPRARYRRTRAVRNGWIARRDGWSPPVGRPSLCECGRSAWRGPHPDYKLGSIQRIDRATGATTTLYTECDGHKLSAPNDIVFDKDGGFYFTDLGKRYARHRDHGGLYYALPDGSKIVS